MNPQDPQSINPTQSPVQSAPPLQPSNMQQPSLAPVKKKGIFSFLKKDAKSDSQVVSPQFAAPSIKKGPPKLLLFVIVLVVILGVLLAILMSQNKTEDYSVPVDTEGTIVWWGLVDESIYEPLISDFESKNPNTKIEYVKQSTINYRERLTNSLARGEGPDIFSFHNSWIPMFRTELDIIPSFVMETSEFEETYYPVAVADLETKQGILGIPLEYDGLALYINEDIFASAGKSVPQTWDQLKDLAKELTQRDARGIIIQSGASLGLTENIDHWQDIVAFMLFQNHATPSNPVGAQARDALLYYARFKNDNLWSDQLPSSTIAFANGDVAMYFGTIERAKEILAINPNLRFKTTTLPQLRRNDPSEKDVSYASYWVQGVWKRSASRGVAWRFLDYLSSREALQEIYRNTEERELIGDPYPRQDMAVLLRDDRIAGSVVANAPYARSWYLAGLTYDGTTGINSQLGAVYSSVLGNGDLNSFETLSKKVREVLAKYGLLAN